jgi:O-antigen/teichoic acid export membrane protein
MVRSIFVQTVFWRVLSSLSWVMVSLVTLKLFRLNLTLPLYGLIGVAVLILGCLPALDGGFRTAINRRILSLAGDADRDVFVVFGQRLYSWFGVAALALGVAIMAAYSLTPNARQLQLPFLFYLLLGSTGAVVVLANAYLQQLIGLGLQRRMFAIQTVMAWTTVLVLWAGFRAGLGIWSFILSTSLPQLCAVALAVPMIRIAAPETRLLDLTWDAGDTARLQDLWREASGVLSMQIWTLALYTVDTLLVGWIWTETQVGRYVIAANLFSKLRLLFQSADEAVWPILAAKAANGERISAGIARLNGWIHGAAMTAAALCIPAFLSGYLGGEWTSDAIVAALMAGRFLITGLAAQPAWWLYGHGHMHSIALHVRRELIASIVLSVPLGWWLGPVGVALGFLVGTAAGMLYPLPAEYARAAGIAPVRLLTGLWSRAAAAGLLAALVSLVGIRLDAGWISIVAFAALAAALPPGIAASVAYGRARKAGVTRPLEAAAFL